VSEALPLVIRVAATYSGQVGFGEVFTCHIRAVLTGRLAESVISLTVLAGDKEKIGFLTAHPSPQEIELGLAMGRRDEPYALAPITGFVDAERSSWEIRYMRAAGCSEDSRASVP